MVLCVQTGQMPSGTSGCRSTSWPCTQASDLNERGLQCIALAVSRQSSRASVLIPAWQCALQMDMQFRCCCRPGLARCGCTHPPPGGRLPGRRRRPATLRRLAARRRRRRPAGAAAAVAGAQGGRRPAAAPAAAQVHCLRAAVRAPGAVRCGGASMCEWHICQPVVVTDRPSPVQPSPATQLQITACLAPLNLGRGG